jgi:ubiquitin-activating enzyme E1
LKQSIKHNLQNPVYFDEELRRAGDSHPQKSVFNTLHLAFEALDTFKKANLKYPRSWHTQDAEEFVKIANELNASRTQPFEKLDLDLLKTFSFVCRGSFCPIQAVIGGMTAQEIMKACTGKFHPVVQSFYFSCAEVLPETPLEHKPTGQPLDRYSSQTGIFGVDFQHKLENIKCFLVGSGALGCEYIKNLAMMGVGCGPNGKVFVTDMDTIEKSNLNRQFLFRSWDVQKAKAEVASRAARKMNPNINIEPNLNRVCPETELIYNDAFFDSLDVVCNALDNVKTRLYIDSKCIEHQKPLIESGTLGTEGNVQVMIKD